MKSNTRRIVAFVMISGACLSGVMGPIAARSQAVDDDSAVVSFDNGEKRAAAARAKMQHGIRPAPRRPSFRSATAKKRGRSKTSVWTLTATC